MKLYDFKMAPNPQRVNMFLAEKGIEIPTIEINTRDRAQFADSFKAVNPISQVPVLELDDGTYISETMAICRYLEELHPEPVLFGRDAKEKAMVEMWSRRAEFMGYLSAADMLRNSSPIFEDRGLPGVPSGVPQIAELVERGRNSMGRFFALFDDRLGAAKYVAGDAFSVADITTFVTIRFAARGRGQAARRLRQHLALAQRSGIAPQRCCGIANRLAHETLTLLASLWRTRLSALPIQRNESRHAQPLAEQLDSPASAGQYASIPGKPARNQVSVC